MPLTVRICVWITVSEINFILIILKLNLERKCIVRTSTFWLSIFAIDLINLTASRNFSCTGVLIISYFLSSPYPSSTPRFCFFLWIYKGSHPIIKGWIWLDKVNNVKLILSESPGVRNLKIEPLGVVVSVIVSFEDQFIFKPL